MSLITYSWFQIAAISEQSSESANDIPDNGSSSTNAPRWKSFDMRSVVASTEDLFRFILSEKGRRVRVFIIQDIIKASDTFLQEEALPCIFEDPAVRSNFEVYAHADHWFMNGCLEFELHIMKTWWMDLTSGKACDCGNILKQSWNQHIRNMICIFIQIELFLNNCRK